MKQLVTVVILAALGFAGWKFWPQIQQAIQDNGEEKKQALANKKNNGEHKKDPTKTPTTGPKGPKDAMGTSTDPKVDPKESPKSTDKKLTTKEPAESSLQVALTLKFELDRKSGKFHLTGTTNLPENTVLRYDLNPLGELGTMVVKKESAKGVFRSPGFPVPTEGFVAVVRMIPHEQDPAIQRQLGAKGEAIEGPPTTDFPEGRQVIAAAQVKLVRNALRVIKTVSGDKAKAAGFAGE